MKSVQLLDFFLEDLVFYLIIEYPSGKNLRDSILDLGMTSLTEEETKNCIGGILRELKTMHDNHYKHGDLCLDSIITQKSR